ncbi:hypothetical protein GGR55DRAFT_345742 [Xylaria sp. FL0064]|nr:hypothetical protein GGR55DRAFT_345742 [Xylaria sp. FL0064]
MLNIVAYMVLFALSQCAYGLRFDGHPPIREGRDGLTTQFVTTVSTCMNHRTTTLQTGPGADMMNILDSPGIGSQRSW